MTHVDFLVYCSFVFISTYSTFLSLFLFFFTDTATTEIYTLSLHDALPICQLPGVGGAGQDDLQLQLVGHLERLAQVADERSEEHTSELQSPMYLVCRLLLEKKKQKKNR